MPRFYATPHDNVNYRLFPLWAPAFFDPDITVEDLIKKKTTRPVLNQYFMVSRQRAPERQRFQSTDPNEMQSASFSIWTMLKMHRYQVPFQLKNEADIVDILDGIDSYALSLKPDVVLGHETITAVVRLLFDWRVEVFKHYFRYIKTHPAALEQLYPNGTKDENIFAMLSDFSYKEEEKIALDPLRVRLKPPYDVDKTIPHSQRPVAEKTFEEQLGINGQIVTPHDPFKFDFDEFMKEV